MRRFIVTLVILGLFSWQKPTFAEFRMTPRQAFYHHAHQGNVNALMNLKKMGYRIDTTDAYGNTALCESVYQKDYTAFAVLRQMGASLYQPCITQMSAQTVTEFNQGYTEWAQAINSGRATYTASQVTVIEEQPANTVIASSKPEVLVPTQTSTVPASSGLSLTAGTMIGIGVTTAAVIGAGIAFASGGGGGGSSAGTSSNNTSGPAVPIVSCNANEYYSNNVCKACLHGGISAGGLTSSCICLGNWTGKDCGECILSGDGVIESTCACDTAHSYQQFGSTCFKVLDCGANAYQSGNSCLCKPGYENWVDGVGCSIVSCGTNYKNLSECGEGYHTTGKTCQSGSNILYECLENTCDTYELSCPADGYVAVPACKKGSIQYYQCNPDPSCKGTEILPANCEPSTSTECKYGSKTLHKCNSCKEGWTGAPNCTTPDSSCTGSETIPTNCDGYSSCTKGSKTLYKCTSCKEGWMGPPNCTTPDSSCTGSETIPSNCDNYSSCIKGTKTLYKCTTCKEGWTGIPNCTTKATCPSEYKKATDCPWGPSTDSCISGTETLYICAPEVCTGGTTKEHCSSFYSCTDAGTGSTLYTCSACKNGWINPSTNCVTENTCTAYSTTECLASEGYEPTGNECYAESKHYIECKAKDCTGYPLPETGCPDGATCTSCISAGITKKKITACPTDYTVNADGSACIHSCPANKYLSGGTCLDCPENSTSPAGSDGFDSCKCISGFKMNGSKCDPVDFPNIGTHPNNGSPSSYETTEFNKGNFLAQIKAEYAYAHGYDGYLANRDSLGNLISTTPTTEKIKVGIWDSNFDVNQPDLVGNIATRLIGGTTRTYGFNSKIGPCRGSSKTNCYDRDSTGYVYWYDEKGNSQYLGYISASSWSSKFSSTYNWDDESTKYNVAPSYSSVSSQTNTADGDHGTHVAGIVAATKNGIGMQGVAPNAELYLSSWTNDNVQNMDKYYAAKYFADSGVRVINASFGIPLLVTNSSGRVITDASGNVSYNSMTASEFSTLSESAKSARVDLGSGKAYQTYADNNIVLVKSAGNHGLGGRFEAGYDTAIPMISDFGTGGTHDLTNLFVTVASLDKRNALASYSQYCGSTAKWCISAPGGDMNKGSYMWKSFGNSYTTYGDLDHANIQLGSLYDADVQWTKNLIENILIGHITNEDAILNMNAYWGITSTVQNNSSHKKEDGVAYGYMQGTSMAAPVVTGAIALIMSAYPHLNSQDVVEILFRSANQNLVGWGGKTSFKSFYSNTATGNYDITTITDELIPGGWTDRFGNNYELSKIYGHGEIDLEAAFKPLGELLVPMSSSVTSKTSIVNSQLALPKFLGSKVVTQFPETILALDDYNRPFTTSIAGKVRQAHHNPNAFKRDFRAFMSPHKIQQAGVIDKLSFSFSSSNTDNDLLGMGILDMNYQFNDKTSLKFSYRSDILNEKDFLDKPLANPFMNMTDSYTLAPQFKYKDLTFSFGATVGKNAFYETDTDKEDAFHHSMHAFDTSVAFNAHKSLTFKVVGGMVQEKEALLGMNGSGMFATDDGTTYFTGTILEYKPIIPLTLSASYYYGQSAIDHTRSLLKINNVVSDSFAFDARYQPDGNNTIGLQFSSPLRIRTGTATLNLPVARDPYNDTVYFQEQKVSLKPDAREYDLGLYYMNKTNDLDWQGQLMMRLHPDHVKEAKPDYRALFGLSYKY